MGSSKRPAWLEERAQKIIGKNRNQRGHRTQCLWFVAITRIEHSLWIRWKPSEHLEQDWHHLTCILTESLWLMHWGQNDWGQGWKQSCSSSHPPAERLWWPGVGNGKGSGSDRLLVIIWIWSHSPVVSISLHWTSSSLILNWESWPICAI